MQSESEHNKLLTKRLRKAECLGSRYSIREEPVTHLTAWMQKGKDTESAISNTVHKIEKHILNGEHCIGVFLSIQAAFDSITLDHINRALLKHGCHPDVVDWYYELITHRNLETTYELFS